VYNIISKWVCYVDKKSYFRMEDINIANDISNQSLEDDMIKNS